MKQIDGVITAMVTSFNGDGCLNVGSMRDSVRFQIANGAAGLCPLGGTGEPLAMTTDEHKRVIDAVVDEAGGRVPIIVGTLLGNQDDIIECGRHARAAGADAIMVIPPTSWLPSHHTSSSILKRLPRRSTCRWCCFTALHAAACDWM